MVHMWLRCFLNNQEVMYMRYLVLLFLSLSLLSPIPPHADSGYNGSLQRAVITEVMHGGGYTYIRCSGNGGDRWIALPQITASVGEWIEFPDVPPLVNFQSKQFGRTFDKIHFVPGIRKSSEQEGVLRSRPDVYRSVDENGSFVFSDNPSRVPVDKRGK